MRNFMGQRSQVFEERKHNRVIAIIEHRQLIEEAIEQPRRVN